MTKPTIMEQLELSGAAAYRLFTSSEPLPLHSFLEAWRSGVFVAEPGYIVAVIFAYHTMQMRHDGRRDGTYRPRSR